MNYDDDHEPPETSTDGERAGVQMTGVKFLQAFILPFVIDGLLTRLIPEAAMFGWILAAWVGFFFLTRGCTNRTQGFVALVYFPFMIIAMVIAAFLVPGFGIPIHGD